MENLEQIKKLAEPLKEWLANNYNPNCYIVVNLDEVVVVSKELGVPLSSDN